MAITGTKGQRAVKKSYPVDEGLIAETTKQPADRRLIVEESSVAQGAIYGS